MHLWFKSRLDLIKRLQIDLDHQLLRQTRKHQMFLEEGTQEVRISQGNRFWFYGFMYFIPTIYKYVEND